MSETIDRLLDLAENRVRSAGFHAVSFRDLADDLGIKSSSVHYHFPKKQDLGVALVERYSMKVHAALKELSKDAKTPRDYLDALCAAYRDALVNSDKICLCGMLGAEIEGLPVVVADAVSEFLESNISWMADRLDPALPPEKRKARATRIVSTLHGGMIMAKVFKNHNLFDDVVSDLEL